MSAQMSLAEVEPGMPTFAWPLSAGDRREMFSLWCEANPEALFEMEMAAVIIAGSGRRVSAKYLVERQRYEGSARLVAVPFADASGERHEYAINNSDTPLLARWLLSRHPGMDVEVRRSMFDEGEPCRT